MSITQFILRICNECLEKILESTKLLFQLIFGRQLLIKKSCLDGLLSGSWRVTSTRLKSSLPADIQQQQLPNIIIFLDIVNLIYTAFIIISLIFLLVIGLGVSLNFSLSYLSTLSQFLAFYCPCSFCLIYPSTFSLPLHPGFCFSIVVFSCFLCILRSSSWSWG